jgi:hypothetical protein
MLRFLAPTLQILDVSGNHLTSLEPFGVLGSLREMKASHNQLESSNSIVSLVKGWGQLTALDVSHNPCVADIGSTEATRNAVIAAAGPGFVSFGGKVLEPLQVTFIRRMKARTGSKTSPRPTERPEETSGAWGVDSDPPKESNTLLSPAVLRMVTGLGATTPFSSSSHHAETESPIPITMDSSLEMLDSKALGSGRGNGKGMNQGDVAGGGFRAFALPAEDDSTEETPSSISRDHTPSLTSNAAALVHHDHDGSSRSPPLFSPPVSSIHYDAALSTAAANDRPPNVGIGTRSGFRSHHPEGGQYAAARTPVRTPSDFKRDSRFAHSTYATTEEKALVDSIRKEARETQEPRASS